MSKKTILMIDDDKSWCEYVLGFCEQKGFKTLKAHFLEDATDILTSNEVANVIIMDGNLGFDGKFDTNEITQKFRAKFPLIPIIACSSSYNDQLKRAGASHSCKPDDIFDMLEKLREEGKL